MGLLDKFLNRIGYEKAKQKTAGFISLEAESQMSKTIESDKITDYQDFIDAYRQLPWLYAGASALAIAATKPTLRIYKEIKEKDKTKKIEIQGEAINDLILRPNPILSWRELIQISIVNLAITGNGFWNLVGTAEDGEISTSNKPIEIMWVKPEQIDIKTPEKGEYIGGYEFTSPLGKKKDLDISEIIHFRLPNPDSYFRGLGALEPAKNTAILEFNAVAYNKSFLENDATPGGLFMSDQLLSDEVGKKIVREWDERHRGAKKKGKNDFIWGGFKYQLTATTPKDAQYMEMRKMNREEMLAVLPGSIPPSIVGLLEYANYSNMEVQSKKFWEDCVIPILGLIADKLTLNLAPHFNPQYQFIWDFSNIKILQEDEQRKATVANMLISSGIKTPNQIIAEMYNGEPYEGGDTYYVPMSWVPAGTAPGEKQKAIIKRDDEKKPSFWQAGERKKILWENFSKRIGAKKRTFRPAVEKYLEAQTESVASSTAKLESINEVRIDRIFNEDKEVDRYFNHFRSRYIEMFRMAGDAGYQATKGILYDPERRESLKEKEEFNVSAEHLAKIEVMIDASGKFFNGTTAEKILALIKQAQEEEWTVAELAKQLRAKLTELTPAKADLIARTEIPKVENFGQLEGYKQNEYVELKGWLCSFVKDSRQSHMDADREYSNNPIPLNEDFIIGGTAMSYPGDPRGEPENICNCLCSTFPEVRI